MNAKDFVILAGCCLFFSGCYSSILTNDVSLDLRKDSKLSIGVDRAGTNFTLSSGLLSESNGMIRECSNQPLRMSAQSSFNNESSSFAGDFFMAMLTFVVPPLSLIPQSENATYTGDYEIKDQFDTLVRKQHFQGAIEGTFSGWYIGRTMSRTDLVTKEYEFSQKNVARLILNDINKNYDDLLVAAKSDANLNSIDQNGDTPLMRAVLAGNTKLAERIASKKAVALNAKNKKGNTALMFAAFNNLTDMVNLLMKKGADINVTNNMDRTALLLAVEEGYVDMVRILLGYGANPNLGKFTLTQDADQQSLLSRTGEQLIAFAKKVDSDKQEQARYEAEMRRQRQQEAEAQRRAEAAEEAAQDRENRQLMLQGFQNALQILQSNGKSSSASSPGLGSYSATNGANSASVSAAACAQCNADSTYSSLMSECKNSRGQSACYRAAAYLCQCNLNAGGCGSSRSALQQCVRDNNANAQSLR